MGEVFRAKVTGSEASEHANQQFSVFSCFTVLRGNGVEPPRKLLAFKTPAYLMQQQMAALAA